jgi:hypothetical protein
MQANEKNALSRRDFLRLAATAAGAIAVTGGGFSLYSKTRHGKLNSKGTVRLNPAFRIKKISSNEIELCTHRENGEILNHQFQGLEADLLQVLAVEGDITKSIPVLAKKHQLSENNCRRQINKYLHEFSESGLVYNGEKMHVTIREIK